MFFLDFVYFESSFWGASWEASWAQGQPGAREVAWRENVPKSLCFTAFEVATPHFVREWRT